MKFENSKGETVQLTQDRGGRFRLTEYRITPWGTGPFNLGGSDYGSYRKLKAEYDRIVAELSV